MSGCSLEWFESLSALHDGEVSEEDAIRIASHVAACAPCRRASSALGGIARALVEKRAIDVPAPVESRARMAVARMSRPRRRAGAVMGIAAAAAAGIVLLGSPSGLPPAMADELVTHHVRGFARERPCDFESSDPDAVARWVEGTLGYRAVVEAQPGARLLGARACTLDGARTAALMYQRDSGEPMTVFVPPPGSSASFVASRLAHRQTGCAKAALGNEVCATGEGALAVGREP